jgi:hypothetical protein
MGFSIIGFVDHLQVVTTNNYKNIADFNTLYSVTVSISRSLVTAHNNSYSSASAIKSSLNGGPFQFFRVRVTLRMAVYH